MRRFYNDKDVIQNTFRHTLIMMIIYELASSLSVMIDGIILAQFLGKYAIAAHGLTTPYVNMVKVVGGFFAAGTQITCTALIGKSQLKESNSVFSLSAMILGIISILLCALLFIFSDFFAAILGGAKDQVNLLPRTSDYLRRLALGLPFHFGTTFLIPIVVINGEKKRVNVATYVMMAVNTAGDLVNVLLIHGGMLGMGITTSIGYLFSFAILLLHFRKKTGIQFTVKGLNPGFMKEVASAGFLPSFTRIWSLIRSYVINMIYVMLVSVTALAANSLLQSNIKVVFICIATAIGQTVLMMTGFLYSEHDKSGLIRMFMAVLSICLGPCVLVSILVIIFARPIVMVFGAERDLIDLTVQALRIFIIGLPIIGIKMFYIYYFQGFKNRQLSFISSIVGEFLYISLASLILVKLFGTTGLWVAYPLSEFLYLVTVFIIAWTKYRHCPHNLEEFLFLTPDFDVSEEDKLDIILHSGDEVTGISETAYDFCMEHQFPKRESSIVALTVEEMTRNVFEHGANDGKIHYVDLKIISRSDKAVLRIRDNCRMFNPNERAELVDETDVMKNVGLRMIFRLTSKTSYINILNLNNLVIEIRRP